MAKKNRRGKTSHREDAIEQWAVTEEDLQVVSPENDDVLNTEFSEASDGFLSAKELDDLLNGSEPEEPSQTEEEPVEDIKAPQEKEKEVPEEGKKTFQEEARFILGLEPDVQKAFIRSQAATDKNFLRSLIRNNPEVKKIAESILSPEDFKVLSRDIQGEAKFVLGLDPSVQKDFIQYHAVKSPEFLRPIIEENDKAKKLAESIIGQEGIDKLYNKEEAEEIEQEPEQQQPPQQQQSQQQAQLELPLDYFKKTQPPFVGKIHDGVDLDALNEKSWFSRVVGGAWDSIKNKFSSNKENPQKPPLASRLKNGIKSFVTEEAEPEQAEEQQGQSGKGEQKKLANMFNNEVTKKKRKPENMVIMGNGKGIEIYNISAEPNERRDASKDYDYMLHMMDSQSKTSKFMILNGNCQSISNDDFKGFAGMLSDKDVMDALKENEYEFGRLEKSEGSLVSSNKRINKAMEAFQQRNTRPGPQQQPQQQKSQPQQPKQPQQQQKSQQQQQPQQQVESPIPQDFKKHMDNVFGGKSRPAHGNNEYRPGSLNKQPQGEYKSR